MAQSLFEAGRHIEIENSVVMEAVDWLIKQQAADGSFPEVGVVNNQAMQGGTGAGVPLTAFVTAALVATQVILVATQMRLP